MSFTQQKLANDETKDIVESKDTLSTEINDEKTLLSTTDEELDYEVIEDLIDSLKQFASAAERALKMKQLNYYWYFKKCYDDCFLFLKNVIDESSEKEIITKEKFSKNLLILKKSLDTLDLTSKNLSGPFFNPEAAILGYIQNIKEDVDDLIAALVSPSLKPSSGKNNRQQP